MFHNQTVALQHQQQQQEKIMDDRDKTKKTKKEKRVLSSSEVDDNRTSSPLQDFNNRRIPSTRRIKKNCSSSICSSSSTSVSIGAPKGCLSFLLSSSSNSSSSSSSSSRSHLDTKPKSFSKITNKPLLPNTTPKSAPVSSRPRSNKPSTKENDLPKKPSSQNSQKNPSFLSQRQSGRKPTSKTTSQRSKLSSDFSTNHLKNPASGRFRLISQRDLKQKHQQSRGLVGVGEPTSDFDFSGSDNLNSIENSTPVGKLACGPSLDYAVVDNDDDDKPMEEDSNSANGRIVKTPPIEASVSPEIQCGGSSNLVLASTATPVCYGAGHLISGVTDKRKCRPRGILTTGGPNDSSGCGNISVCEDDSNENAHVVFTKSRPSLIPLPMEASMTWLLSPQNEEDKVQKDDSVSAHTAFMDPASMRVSSSPSSFCPLHSDLVNDSGDKDGSGNEDAITSTGKTRRLLLSPRRLPNFQRFLETPCEKYGDSLVTPQAKSSSKTDNRQKPGDSSYGFVGEEILSSVDQLSSSNIIQTPTSDSSLDRNVGISWIDASDCQINESNPGMGPVAEIFHRTSVSPRNQVQNWDPPGLSSQFTDLTSASHSIDRIQLQKNLDNCASWVSDTTVGNVSLSQMRISWREASVNRGFDAAELDCCRCLSDEENYGDRSDEVQHKSPKAFGMEERNSFRNDDLKSPEFLVHEPEILIKGKKAFSPVGTTICAESISTDADGLVASEDSDWTLSYKNRSFEV